VSSPTGFSRAAVAATIDHTLLRPDATAGDVERLCAEAKELGVFAVCVSPTLVRAAAAALGGSGIAVASVVGFPSGTHVTGVKALEAATAVADGADEIDMVIDLGVARAGRWRDVAADVAGVRTATGPGLLKVIIESGLWDPEALAVACHAAEAGGADFVKTSTGFHPAGGATVEAVEVMAAAVGGRLGVKASGGIATAAQATALLGAGATRLGLSRSAAVLGELD
jgi:deoxyribose-phosphate aldolase